MTCLFPKGILDSSGLGSLIAIRKILKTEGKHVSLIFTKPHLKRMFEIMGIDRLLSIFPDEKFALLGVFSRSAGSRTA